MFFIAGNPEGPAPIIQTLLFNIISYWYNKLKICNMFVILMKY